MSPTTGPAGDLFESLARTADAIADTAERSARVHDAAVGRLPGAAEHARRERRLAAAERAAAEAFRRHEIPSRAVTQAIRDCGHQAVDDS
ncbi:hypothetical protein GCM10020358_29500 [Amorphoplanes nipponensis]|uniref:Uncharacterized protein n=1 Tax=Actinoplanes nipponensis TaxID=135950 RepID=A0A919MY68_9ACTN|nr:hypothetical protein [Actinoplanes nipponensis]GIE54170.1 hypothetical protein Ani05nite_77040 [Actinoplanes nipponensis]